MEVTRIRTDSGSHIEPPFESSWSDLEKLTWSAAVVSHDTGVKVTIREGDVKVRRFGVWHTIPGEYIAIYTNHSAMIGRFQEAWSWLNGFSAGAGQ
jgi:hypothetical protein